MVYNIGQEVEEMQILYEDELIVVGRDANDTQGEIFVQHKQDPNVVISISAWPSLSDDNDKPCLEVQYKANAVVKLIRSEGHFLVA